MVIAGKVEPDTAVDEPTADPSEQTEVSGSAVLGAAPANSEREGRPEDAVDAAATELRDAIDGGQLLLHYQPIVATDSGATVALEALVRWRHPVRGLVPPSEFIPLAERTGLIAPLTLWVLDEALRTCRAWNDEGNQVAVSVNISTRTLYDRAFPGLVARGLTAHDLSADRLILEITESVVMHDPARALETLTELRHLGVGLALDDFGTGYSSLAYLHRLPLNSVKIDRAFVQALTTDERAAAIVRATVGLAHTLGFAVVAEGVENDETYRVLCALGTNTAQGYFFSRPLPAGEAATWMRSHTAVAPRRTGLRILVVDDEPGVRLAAELLLDRAGFQVLAAASAREALRLCRQEPVDLVLIDLRLGRDSGSALATELRTLKPGVRTLFMSGHQPGPDVPTAAAVLAKPFGEHALLSFLRGALN